MRRSIRMNPGLLATPKQDADLLIALLEGDLQQLANALRRRGKVPLCHRIWQLPLYHAVVLSPAGSVPLLEAVAAAGAPIEVAEMSCFIVSKELQVVLDKKISPEQRSMVQEIFGSRRTAAELAAAHGRRDLLTALLDAGACPDLGSNCYALACAAAQQCFQGGPAQIEAAAAAAANTLDVLLQRGACADSCAEAAIDVYWRQRDQRNQAAAALLLCWILDRTMRQQRLRDSCDGIRCKLFTAAAAVGNARMVSHFTAHFTTLDPISYLGREVMMQAAESGNLTALQCLLQLAASTPGNNRVQLFKQGLLDARDHAADKALREQQPEALRLLLANGVKVTVQRINLAVAQWNMSQLQVLLSSGQPRPAAEVHGCRLRLVGSWQHDAYRACPVWNVFKMVSMMVCCSFSGFCKHLPFLFCTIHPCHTAAGRQKNAMGARFGCCAAACCCRLSALGVHRGAPRGSPCSHVATMSLHTCTCSRPCAVASCTCPFCDSVGDVLWLFAGCGAA